VCHQVVFPERVLVACGIWAPSGSLVPPRFLVRGSPVGFPEFGTGSPASSLALSTTDSPIWPEIRASSNCCAPLDRCMRTRSCSSNGEQWNTQIVRWTQSTFSSWTGQAPGELWPPYDHWTLGNGHQRTSAARHDDGWVQGTCMRSSSAIVFEIDERHKLKHCHRPVFGKMP
jgi:hypothetical protein